MESCPTHAVLPLVGLAADKLIRDRYISGGRMCPGGKLPDASRPPVGRTRGGQTHPRPVQCFVKARFQGWIRVRRRHVGWADERNAWR
ncbi:MAG: hypothetical protein ACQESR_16725 [Planctomycetota bacterium]